MANFTTYAFGGFCECGDHAWAVTHQRMVILVSPVDAPLLTGFVWAARRNKSRGRYVTVARTIRRAGRSAGDLRLSREILATAPGTEGDHKNRNPLDNRRPNIREATRLQNTVNTKPKGGSSRFKGVYRDKRLNRWRAAISINRRATYLGVFQDEAEAALAYDIAAVKLFGEFACTNQMLGLL